MNNSLVECDRLSINYGKRKVLNDISMSVMPSEIVSIIGPNGSGKTTLFKAIIGALKPSSGSINKAANLKLGYVPQKLHIDETLPMSVSRFMNLPSGHSREAITQALTHAGVPNLDKQQIMDLSGGQFQRVLLARALLGSPDILLLDEANQGLDHRGTADFYRQVNEIREKLGCAVLMISHELHVVMRKTDRVICLNQNICCQGKPEVVGVSQEYKNLFGLDDDESALYLHQNHGHQNHVHQDTEHLHNTNSQKGASCNV